MQHTGHEMEQMQWLDEQLAELATLQEIGLQLNAKPEIDHVMRTTLDWAMHTTCAISGTISLLEHAKAPGGACPGSDQATLEAELPSHSSAPGLTPGLPMLRVVAHQGCSPEMAQCWQTRWPLESELAGQVVHTGETAVINNAAHASHDHTPRNTDAIEPPVSPCSYLIAPIKRQDSIVGLICLESTVPDGFTAAHVSFLARMTDLAAIAIENAQLYEQMNQRLAELEALRKTGLELTSSLHLEAVLDSTLKHSQTLTGADHIAILLYDEHRGLYYQKELPRAETWAHPFTPEDQVAQEVARTGKAQVAYQNRGPSAQQDAAPQMSTIASIPLINSNGLLGVLTASFQKAPTFTQDKLRVLHLLADQAAIAIENAQLYAEIQHAQDAQNDLVSAALHEFKAPLTSIQGYTSLMLHPALIALQENGPFTEQQKAYLEVIQKNVQRINALVDHLIDVSGTEPGPVLRQAGNRIGSALAVE